MSDDTPICSLATCLQGRPYPKPRWAIQEPPPLELTLEEFYDIKSKIQFTLRNTLQEQNYNSVKLYLHFYEQFKQDNVCLFTFFKKFTPTIDAKNLTCVGMAMELLNRWQTLDEEIPQFTRSCMLVSCEQDIGDIDQYVLFKDPESMPKTDKEHTLVCVKIKIDGRPGVMLADPGFHVAQIITVMLDRGYPHTGRLIQTDLPNMYKEFHYNFNSYNKNYVEWHDISSGRTKKDKDISLIYIAKPYLEGINVTIRRNLVYKFKSIVSRNEEGQITAGVYFNIQNEENAFTMISPDDQRSKTKVNFALFSDGQVLPETLKQKIDEVNATLRFEKGHLTNILRRIAKIKEDTDFLQQMFVINRYIKFYTPYEFELEDLD